MADYHKVLGLRVSSRILVFAIAGLLFQDLVFLIAVMDLAQAKYQESFYLRIDGKQCNWLRNENGSFRQ
jgi:hypothetical protein